VLLDVTNALRATLRSRDPIIRHGGDEFACVISGLKAAGATRGLALVDAALAQASEPASVTVEVSDLQPNDSREDLLALGRRRAVPRTPGIAIDAPLRRRS
jgi:GGDEF domain-containing protein